ncbi:MAG TPA: glycosyltransferase [Rubrivivax sp.]|nr:glycosyltransferase [Rubrivivax sp.]
MSGDARAAASAADAARPWVSMLLIAYRQAGTVGAAVAGALAQTYSPLEIVVSDDASGDGTWDAIEAALAGYAGPHRIVRNRNARNLGIGAHLSKLAAMARGELLFVTAGDDVSQPERCERTVQAWLAHGRRPDLIACPLLDIDAAGAQQGLLQPSDLGAYRGAGDWIARPPHVIGAGQAWTRRLVERFGPLPEGTVAEDLVMVFRAIVSGGAITLAEPLVAYRRGGLSRRRRALRAADVRRKLLANARHSLVELPCLLRDAELAGVRDEVAPALERQLARERHIAAQFDAAATPRARLRRLLRDRAVPAATRLRVFAYAALPWLLAPWFALKRLALGRRAQARASENL